MGNFYILNESAEVLYFGKTPDVDACHLRGNKKGILEELSYTVPGNKQRVFERR